MGSNNHLNPSESRLSTNPNQNLNNNSSHLLSSPS